MSALPHQLDILDWLAAQPSEPAHVPVQLNSEPGPVEPVLLHRVDPEANMRRFYRLTVARGLFGEWGLVRQWGRIGGQGRSQTEWHDTREGAQLALGKAGSRKRRRGYRDQPAS